MPKLSMSNGDVERLSEQEIRHFLAQETLFRESSPAAIQGLSCLALQKIVPKDCTLFSMGQSCEALHFIARGCGLLVKIAPDGRQRILHRAVAGEMVGAVAFFDGKEYPATFVAESECIALSFPRDRLLGLVASAPELSLSIIGGVVGRLRLMVTKLEQMSFEDTTHRLWGYLVENSAPSGDGTYPRVLEPLPTREHIAGLIGTVREVVSRRLSRLVAEGHVKIEGARLVLLEPLE